MTSLNKLFTFMLWAGLALSGCNNNSSNDGSSTSTPAPDYQLTINGPDGADRGTLVTLSAQLTRDGEAIDPDDGFSWSQEAGEHVGLTVGDSDNEIFFYAPDFGDSATLGVTATADGQNLEATFEVSFTDVEPTKGLEEDLVIKGPVRVAGNHDVLLNAVYTRNGEVSDAQVTWQQDAGPDVGMTPEGMALGFTAPDVTTDTPLLFSATVEESGGILLVTFYEVTVTVDGIAFGNQVNPDGQQLPQSSQGQAAQTQRPVQPGATVLLTSQALSSGLGNGTVTYQWQQIGGTPVQLQNANSANASFVAPTQAGGASQKLIFTVTATAPNGQSAVQTQVVNVQRPSSFVPSQVGAQHQVYNGHGAITLSAGTVGGTQPLTYTWYEGATVSGGKPITGATGASYTVTPPTVTQNTTFNYVVRVTDADGHTVDISHVIDVVSAGGQGGTPPPAKSQPLAVTFPVQTPQTVIAGDRIAPVASASGGSGNYAFQWTVDTGKVKVISGQNTATPVFELLATAGTTQTAHLKVRATDGTTDANGAPNETSKSLALQILPIFRIDNHQNQAGGSGATGPGNSAVTPAVVESGNAFHPSVGVQQTGKPGGSFSYQWTVAEPDPLPPGLSVTIAGSTTQSPVVVASGATTNTPIRLKAVVTYTTPNGNTYSQTTSSEFTSVPVATPLRPAMTISLPGHAEVHPGRTVHPSVSVSNPDGSPRYSWTQVAGPTVVLVNPRQAATEFTVPQVSGHTDIVLEVTVSDNSNNPPRTARVTYTVDPLVPPGLAMTVVAAPGRNVYENETVGPLAKVLNSECASAGTSCPSYRWSVTQQPTNTVSLTDADTPSPSFVVPGGGGVLELEVAVTDDRGTEYDTVRYQLVNGIEVTARPTAELLEGVSLDLLASVANVNGSVSYQWTAENNGQAVSLSKDDQQQVTVAAQAVDSDTPVTLRVTVTDNSNSASADVKLTVKNRLLRVDAGADQVVPLMQSASLHANPSGGLPPYSYSWTPASALNATTGDSVTTVGLNQSLKLPVSVEVTDALGNKGGATVNVSYSGQYEQLSLAGGKSIAIAGLPTALSAQVLNIDPAATLRWQWAQLTGPSVTLTDADTSAPGFTAPNTSGELTFEATVTELGGAGRSASKVYTAQVIDPPALAVVTTQALYGLQGGTLQLDATVTRADGSSAVPADVKALAVKESSLSTCGHTISNGSVSGQTSLRATLDLGGSVGNCIYEVIATEPNDTPVVKQLSVRVSAPVALAPSQARQTVTSGTTVQLTVPVAPDRSVAWAQTGGDPVTISSPSTAQASFVAPAAENGDKTLIFTATVGPGVGSPFTETVNAEVLVHEPALKLSLANNQVSLAPGGTVTLSATVLDGDGNQVSPADYDLDWDLSPLQPYPYISVGPQTNPLILELSRAGDYKLGPDKAETLTFTVTALATAPGRFVQGSSSVSVEVKGKVSPPSAEDFLRALKEANQDLNNALSPGSTFSLHGVLPDGFQGMISWQGALFGSNTVAGPSPQGTLPKADACARSSGSITVTAVLTAPDELKGQTVTTTLPYRSKRAPGALVPVAPVSCHLCQGPKFICERSHATQVCADNPVETYCINNVENLRDGSRYVTRECATAQKARDAFNTADHNTKPECVNYDTQNLVDSHFTCSFPCRGNNCNIETVPTTNRALAVEDILDPEQPQPADCAPE